jgi:glycosyltransferase involved in cell wall biosynthesis
VNFALIVTNLAGGGAERAMLNLAALLAGRGHGVDLILLERVIEHAVPENVSLHIVTPADSRLRHGWLGKRVGAWRLARLWKELDARKPIDLTISTLPYCDEVVRHARLPRVRYRIANTLSAEIDWLARHDPSKARRRLDRYRALYGGQALIAVSEGVATDLRERLGIAADIAAIYNPFDFQRILRLAAEPTVDLPKRPYVIHVGRFAPQKRHDLLLDAWKLVGLDMELILLTDPAAGLIRLIEAKGLAGRVTVAGFRPNPFPWIAAAELLVLCSDHEGMPNVLVEALACGTRVVSTDCPSGPREVLRGELAHWLVPMNDATALAARMCEALRETRPQRLDEIDAFAAGTVAARYEALAAGVR